MVTKMVVNYTYKECFFLFPQVTGEILEQNDFTKKRLVTLRLIRRVCYIISRY